MNEILITGVIRVENRWHKMEDRLIFKNMRFGRSQTGFDCCLYYIPPM